MTNSKGRIGLSPLDFAMVVVVVVVADGAAAGAAAAENLGSIC